MWYRDLGKTGQQQMIHSTVREKNRRFMGYGFSLIVCWILMVVHSGCGRSESCGEDPAVVIGSTRLTLDQLKREMAFIGGDAPARYPREVRDRLIEEVVDYYLILEYGRQHNISIPEKEFQKYIEEIRSEYPEGLFQKALLQAYVDPTQWEHRLRNQLLVARIIRQVFRKIDPPSYEEIKEYYRKNRARFRSPEMIRFRQVLCRSEGEAKAIRKRILAGEDMGKLAQTCSVAPEAGAGGEVGWVARGCLDPSMEDALFSLECGKISPVVKTPFGFHVFQVISRRRAGVKGLAEVIDQIESRLISRKQEVFYRKWVNELRSQFRVEIDRDRINSRLNRKPG